MMMLRRSLSERELIAKCRSVRREWLRTSDFLGLGVLHTMVARIFDCSHGLKPEQRIALSEMLRCAADEIEHRLD